MPAGDGVAARERLHDLFVGQRIQPAANLVERQVFFLQPPDQPKPGEMRLGVAGATPAPSGRREQSLLDVEMNRARRDIGLRTDLDVDDQSRER